MNVTRGMFKAEKKRGNYRKQFVFVAKTFTHFWNSGVCSSMSAKNATKKLQKIAKEKKTIEEWTQTKARGGNGIVENNKSRKGVENSKKRRLVEYSAVGYRVAAAFIINVGMCKREGV